MPVWIDSPDEQWTFCDKCDMSAAMTIYVHLPSFRPCTVQAEKRRHLSAVSYLPSFFLLFPLSFYAFFLTLFFLSLLLLSLLFSFSHPPHFFISPQPPSSQVSLWFLGKEDEVTIADGCSAVQSHTNTLVYTCTHTYGHTWFVCVCQSSCLVCSEHVSMHVFVRASASSVF